MYKIGSNQNSNVDLKKQIRRHQRMSETEKLIRDTLLHESKSIKPSSKSLVVNGLFDFAKPRNKSIIRSSRASDITDTLVFDSKKRKLSNDLSNIHVTQGEKKPISSINGFSMFSMNSNSKNPLRDAGEGDHIICQQTANCMKIVLNNTARHNLLTTNVSYTAAQSGF